jgi:hypothetical protein|tara:strand:- start:979 stop:1209 length:231 start_codon:yes stop_codon:yes gene_type:complete
MENDATTPKPKKKKRNAYKPNQREERCDFCNKKYKACRPWQHFCSQRCRLNNGNERVSDALKALREQEKQQAQTGL